MYDFSVLTSDWTINRRLISFSVAPSGGGGKCAHEDKIEVRCSDGVSVSFGSTLIFALNIKPMLRKRNYSQKSTKIS